MTLDKIFEYARTHPERVAIYANDQAITYRDFAQRVVKARAILETQDIPGDKVTFICINHTVAAWTVRLALASLGHLTAAVGFLSELRHFTPEQIGFVVMLEGEPRPALAEVTAKYGFSHLSLPSNFMTGADGKLAAPHKGRAIGGHLIFTSGTTGTIKKMLIDANNEAINLEQRLQAFAVEGDSVVTVFDWAMWSSVGYTVPLGVWSIGASIVFAEATNRRAVLRHPGLSRAIATPNIVDEILKSTSGTLERQEGLRLYVGGGPLPAAIAEAASREIAGQLWTMVGSTEAGVWCVTPIESPEDLVRHRIAPSRLVQIVDEDGSPLPAGETGAVRIQVLKGTDSYYGDKESSQNFFRDGFFYSGDLGAVDAEGRLMLQGRATDIVYINGMKRAVAPFERALQARLGQREVCIFGSRDGGLDERIHVAILGRPGLGQAAMKNIIREELPRFPRVHLHFLDAFPRNDRGKVVRHELKRQILENAKTSKPA
jgi:acyl-coenzyme A synthetase/AMP-(fatty) acid ligase